MIKYWKATVDWLISGWKMCTQFLRMVLFSPSLAIFSSFFFSNKMFLRVSSMEEDAFEDQEQAFGASNSCGFKFYDIDYQLCYYRQG